tara:strand:- start:716 stop:946 length:231 start_codon:yes stop_codon:yes gene_type:complete
VKKIFILILIFFILSCGNEKSEEYLFIEEQNKSITEQNIFLEEKNKELQKEILLLEMSLKNLRRQYETPHIEKSIK